MNEAVVTEMQDVVYDLAVSPNFVRDGICFAAQGSGLYRSEDGGRSWFLAYGSLNLSEPLATTSVVLSPDFVHDRTVFAGAPGGTLRSEDGGQSWLVTMLPTPPPTVSSLVISPNYSHDGVLLLGTMEDGVFRSANRGSSWNIWNFGLLDLNVLALAISPNFANDETLFAGTESGLFRSTNGGRAWREVNLPSGFEPVISLTFSPHYAQDGAIWVGTESQGLFYSADDGESWTHLGETAINDTVNRIMLGPDYPTKAEILVLLGDTLLISRDNGHRWSPWREGLHFEQGTTTVKAPWGLAPNVPLLIGLASGGVVVV